MKNLLRCIFVLVWVTVLSGCGLLCQAGTGTCGMSDEEATKLLHPKAYGEYWVKPGVTKEVWRQDWVDCGGMRDGAYSSGALSGSTNAVLHAASEKKTGELSTCMQSKGYVFQRS